MKVEIGFWTDIIDNPETSTINLASPRPNWKKKNIKSTGVPVVPPTLSTEVVKLSIGVLTMDIMVLGLFIDW